MSSEYPEWHKQPRKLSSKEMADPMTVIHEFFDGYHLPEARRCIHDMLSDALCPEGSDNAGGHLTWSEDVEKLIEAAYLFHQQHQRFSVDHGIAPGENESETLDDDDDVIDIVISPRMRSALAAFVRHHPPKSVHHSLRTILLDYLAVECDYHIRFQHMIIRIKGIFELLDVIEEEYPSEE